MNMHEFEKMVDELVDIAKLIGAVECNGAVPLNAEELKFQSAISALLAAYSATQWHERKEDGGIDEPYDSDRWIVIVYNESESHGCISGKYAKSILSGYFVKRWCYLPEDK